jgi:hypothetical protein
VEVGDEVAVGANGGKDAQMIHRRAAEINRV